MDLSSLLQHSPALTTIKPTETTGLPEATQSMSRPDSGKSFDSAISDAISEANATHVQADEAMKMLASGEDVDLHGTMIAIEKASIATRLTLQVRNKALEAYQEIMRMQV